MIRSLWSRSSPPPNGQASVDDSGGLRFDPAPNFHGVVDIEYRVSDGRGGADLATLRITVRSVNDAPVANDDEAVTSSRTTVVIDMLANDLDVDGDTLTVATIGNPSHGVVTDTGDGALLYTPNPGFDGDDVFEYTVSDGQGGRDTGRVSIAVAAPVDPSQPEWEAYNDLAPTRGASNGQNVTEHDYQATTAPLINSATGAPLTVTMTGSTGGGYDPQVTGGAIAAGTDATDLFGDQVDLSGVHELDAAGWHNTVTFDGLDATKQYTITLTANRNERRYNRARFTRVTVVGADTLANESSDGVVVYSDASVSFSTGYNRDNGYVARWTRISAADGSISIVSEWDDAQGAGSVNTKGYAMAVFKLEQYNSQGDICLRDTDCNDDNICTQDRCDSATRLCVFDPTQAPCDDGIDCTTNDACAGGICTGGAGDHTRCDDGNVCTDGVCDLQTGCRFVDNQAGCDDGIDCTADDQCADGACAGHDACLGDQSCEPETGRCVGGPGGAGAAGFTAYNDLAWGAGQRADGITRFTAPAGGSRLPSEGELVDFATGQGTGVTLRVSGGLFNGDGHANDGRNPPAGTDAFDVFGDVVSTLGAVAYVNAPNNPLVLTFSGLDPDTDYTVVFHADRGRYAWQRASLVSLLGAEALVNASTAAVDNPDSETGGALYTGPNDDSTRLPADNPRGYVARFQAVRSGGDGEIALVIKAAGSSGYKGKYASAVMLQAAGGDGPLPECAVDRDCEDDNLCTDNTCDLPGGTCSSVFNRAPCDDGVACTEGDQCSEGACQAGRAQHNLCDDDDVCTDDVCDAGAGCQHPENQSPCDDGVVCTVDDRCAALQCAGTPSCLEGQTCDLEIGACVGEVISGSGALFRAYNDLAWINGQLASNITTFTSPAGGSGLSNRGELVDSETGEVTGVMLTVTGGTYNGQGHGTAGRDAPQGTDAADIFGGIVGTRGAISYVNVANAPLVLTFEGLDHNTLYSVVFHGDRDLYGWDRASRVELAGADAFANHSTAAVDNPDPTSGGALFGGPDDPTTRLPADNANGYVARFDQIEAGDDGEILLVVSADGNRGWRGKYGSAVLLEAVANGCQVDADCDDGDPCTDNLCDSIAGTCTDRFNTAPCDDGQACTLEDACAEGACAGVARCPEGVECDPETGVCASAYDWLAYNDLNADGSDNHPNVTAYDYRATDAPLVSFETGAQLPVTMTGVTIGGYDPKLAGGGSGPLTDAHDVFGGIVDLAGVHELDAVGWQNIVLFENLDPTKTYTITLTTNRNEPRYRDARYVKVTLVGAESSINESSDGVVLNDDTSVSFSAGYNVAGYVARWTKITAPDGRISIISEWDDKQGAGRSNIKGYAMAAFRLEQQAGAP